MRVLFLLEQVEVLDLLDDPDEGNPGVGGTSYLILQLANRLYQEWKHHAANDHEITLGCWVAPSKCRHYRGMNVFNISNQAKGGHTFDITVATGGALEAIGTGQLIFDTKKLIAWIHHPYDWGKMRLAKRLNAEIVSIGSMQYFSNALIGGRHNRIENIFNASGIRKHLGSREGTGTGQTSSDNCVNIGYMGALIPSKGFHTIIENWDGIKKSTAGVNKKPKLQVIGGSTLYSYAQSHPSLPCELKYGTYIEKLMARKGIGSNDITFHGVMGSNRYQVMAMCDLAIVNPEGYGEAFPATILEWLCLGIPALTSKRFGLSDVASYVPELCLDGPNDLGKKITHILELSPQERTQLECRCKGIADLYSSKQPHIVQQWSYLLSCINENLQKDTGGQSGRKIATDSRMKIDGYPTRRLLGQLIADYLDMALIRLKCKAKSTVDRIRKRI